MNQDWCVGCEVPEQERVNLPHEWRLGESLPAGLTIHSSERDPRRFAFRGHPALQDRVYLDAIATEAGTAETENTGSVHEGAGPQDIAQPLVKGETNRG